MGRQLDLDPAGQWPLGNLLGWDLVAQRLEGKLLDLSPGGQQTFGRHLGLKPMCQKTERRQLGSVLLNLSPWERDWHLHPWGHLALRNALNLGLWSQEPLTWKMDLALEGQFLES